MLRGCHLKKDCLHNILDNIRGRPRTCLPQKVWWNHTRKLERNQLRCRAGNSSNISLFQTWLNHAWHTMPAITCLFDLIINCRAYVNFKSGFSLTIFYMTCYVAMWVAKLGRLTCKNNCISFKGSLPGNRSWQLDLPVFQNHDSISNRLLWFFHCFICGSTLQGRRKVKCLYLERQPYVLKIFTLLTIRTVSLPTKAEQFLKSKQIFL